MATISQELVEANARKRRFKARREQSKEQAAKLKASWQPKETLRGIRANLAPLAKEAKQELGATGSTIKREAVLTAKAWYKHSPMAYSYILTPRGRSAILAYYGGSYNIIPTHSVRAQLLDIAYRTGSFNLVVAQTQWGTDGNVATDLLLETGLIQRRS